MLLLPVSHGHCQHLTAIARKVQHQVCPGGQHPLIYWLLQDVVIAHPAGDWVSYFEDPDAQAKIPRTVDIPAKVEQDPDSGVATIVDTLEFSFPRLLPDHHRLLGLAYNKVKCTLSKRLNHRLV